MEFLMVIAVVIAGRVLYDVVTVFRRQATLATKKLEVLRQEMNDSGYLSAHTVMARLCHEQEKTGDYIMLLLIHEARCEGRIDSVPLFRKYLAVTEAELDQLVLEGVLVKRIEQNNVDKQIWYKFVHKPKLRLAA